MASVGNRLVQPSIDLPHPKPVPVRVLASVLCVGANPFHSISAVFKLPDELILSILSHMSPDPSPSGHYARFRMPYSVGMSDCHNQRVDFLRPLSATCRAMRLRLLPWDWERLEMPQRVGWALQGQTVQRLNTIVNGPYAGTFLATNLKYFCALLRP